MKINYAIIEEAELKAVSGGKARRGEEGIKNAVDNIIAAGVDTALLDNAPFTFPQAETL